MKLKFLKNRKIVDGKLTIRKGSHPILDLPYLASKRTGFSKYIDYRPLYLKDDNLPKFVEDDNNDIIVIDRRDNLERLIVISDMKTIEEISDYPNDKPLVWVKSIISETRYYGYSKSMFDSIQYIPVYEKEEG